MARVFIGNGRTQVAANILLDPKPTLSVSVWIYPTSFAPAYQTIAFYPAGSYWEIMLKSTGKLAWYISPVSTLDPGSITLSINTWSHLAFTYVTPAVAGVGFRPFVNGVSDGTTTSTAEAVSSGVLYMGGENVTRFYNGGMADLAIWNAVLTAAEIQMLASGLRAKYVRPASLTAYFPMTGLTPNEPDLTPYANVGVLPAGTKFMPNPPLIPDMNNIFNVKPEGELPALFLAPSFISGWSRQSNLPVIGGGTF